MWGRGTIKEGVELSTESQPVWVSGKLSGEETEREAENETEKGPVGLLGMEAFLCPLFLVCREQISASSFLSPKRQVRTVANQGREGIQRAGGAAKTQ